jgi:DNA polymerase-3 subunit delta'
MDGARTRGQPAALAAIGAMVRAGAPGAVLLVGPAGVGKTTLAIDLAAGLLCTQEPLEVRPCGSCRACRLVARGVHPDVHRLGPEGPGRQVVIGGPGSRARGVRDLIAELALLPVEGGARVAIVEGAHRMNEDAQAALLKTLEEPPAGVTIVLCADAEEPLLPTIRSRCARIRLGPVGVRDIEAIFADADAADPPLAARLARIAAGRPGIALAWAARPDAIRERDSIGRSLLPRTACPASARSPRRLPRSPGSAMGPRPSPRTTVARRAVAASAPSGPRRPWTLAPTPTRATLTQSPRLGHRRSSAAVRRRR